MSRPRLVVHGHFYQPPRLDPFTGTMPVDPTAAPARDWNERISADCYRPNALAGNLGAISWDLGPTLAGWLETGDPVAYRGFVEGDRGANGMAQPFHHAILPLAAAHDRRTEIRWGLRDFEIRFGRKATGMWLPETAVDLATLRLLADAGVTHTVLAPWQVDVVGLDTRVPVRIDLGDGRSMFAALYDAALSTAVSFEPWATVDADRFVTDRVIPRLDGDALPAGVDPLVIIATDGELYGHHQPLREQFLARLVGATAPIDRPFEHGIPLSTAILEAAERGIPPVRLRERTSWSCHHGVDRWAASCACVPDGSWKGPLRFALERLAGAVDALTERVVGELPGSPDPWAARNDYVDVVIGACSEVAFGNTWLDPAATAAQRSTFAAVMHAQRWRLAMFASCAWFWEDPLRVETAGALRAATRAARLIDHVAGTGVERRFVDDLALLRGPGGQDGHTLLRAALVAVGQRPRDRSAVDDAIATDQAQP